MRRIFAAYASVKSPCSIAAALNAKGAPSPSDRAWNEGTIRGNAKKRDGRLRNQAHVGAIVYGWNRFGQNPDTSSRLSRPADEADIVHCGRPKRQIISDQAWNAMPDRLAQTYAQHARPQTSTLNVGRLAKCILSRLMSCDVCGGGDTIVGKDRYRCYDRKSKGRAACNNKTIKRQTHEERVQKRLRKGLTAPELIEAFRAEAPRPVELRRNDVSDASAILARKPAEVEARITRSVEQIEAGSAARILRALSSLGRLSARSFGVTWRPSLPRAPGPRTRTSATQRRSTRRRCVDWRTLI